MRISIIVVTHNRSASLRRTLSCLNQLRVPPGAQAELILVDNASTDDTTEVLREFRHREIALVPHFEARKGRSHALNTALKVATGDVLLFTDDDVEVSPDWAEAHLRHFSRGSQAVVGRIQLAPNLERPWLTREHRWYLAVPVQEAATGTLVGANMAVSRAAFRTVPSFDSELGAGGPLGSGEEFLFWCQLKQAGFSLVMAEDAVVVHHPSETRLQRKSWLSAATAVGRSGAYIDYHWEHVSGKRALERLVTRRMKLILKRGFAATPAPEAEGCPLWELSLAQDIAYWRQMRIEASRKRCYEKFGLRKLNGI